MDQYAHERRSSALQDTNAMGHGSEEAQSPRSSDLSKSLLEKKLVRKLDCRLMPVLVVMIVLNYLDRNALPNARIQGIEDDLGLKGSEFNTCISVLFAGYIALQIPSNLILTRVRPSIYLPTCMALWGLVSGCTALVKGFHSLVVCRFFLGFLEAPFFPGALFLLSAWYTKKELATRMAILYTGSLLSGGFGGLVGAGIQSGLDGAHGLHSWQWLFIIEGAITVGLSILSIFVLPDFPATTKWLTDEERSLAVNRLKISNGYHDEERGSITSGLWMALTDYKVWLLSAIIITKTSAAAVTSFIPTLVGTFEFSRIKTLLLVAPPYVFAAIVAMAVSISSDKLSERYFHTITPLMFGMVGYIIAATTTSLAPRYFSLFLMLGGVYGAFNVTYAWVSSTLPRPLEKRAAALAMTNMIGNFAQIYSPYLYEKDSGPRYLPAMIANSCFVLAAIIIATVLRFCLVAENKKLDRLENEPSAATEVTINEDGEKVMEGSHAEFVGSNSTVLRLNPGFRYAL